MSTSTGVNHKTNVSRPQHRGNQFKDKVVPNNSQVKLKKTQVEEHPRISSISNKIKSVTACNDSLNSRTLNVNVVCTTCKIYLVDSDYFACVTKMLNDVNARTKKPNVVPISTRKPKGHANRSVATLHKKTVASKSTTQKPKSYYRMLYEKTESTSSTPLRLMAKASPTQAWLWHRRLSHLNFDYIHLLSKKDVVIGLQKLKFIKDQLCSSCEATLDSGKLLSICWSCGFSISLNNCAARFLSSRHSLSDPPAMVLCAGKQPIGDALETTILLAPSLYSSFDEFFRTLIAAAEAKLTLVRRSFSCSEGSKYAGRYIFNIYHYCCTFDIQRMSGYVIVTH
nr:integrase, catalytic region, zinc finger, CCHC-type, peptidase aspartic, catalytic [Tanacetum cinerariifolium]